MSPILIVDHEPEYRDYLRQAVERLGFEAVIAPTARAALALIGETRVAAVVTAIVMPDMDGIELARALREGADSTPILALARATDVADIYLKAALAVGATFAGRKGEDDLALLEELVALVGMRQRLRRRAQDR